jgi:hypothetical protein
MRSCRLGESADGPAPFTLLSLGNFATDDRHIGLSRIAGIGCILFPLRCATFVPLAVAGG